MKIDLKKILKTFKLNESTISMVLGALVIIVVGMMVANYFKDRGSVPVSGEGSKVEVTSEEKTNTYKVVKGDNLWKIAEKETGSGFNWKKIAEENNLKDPGQIEVDQELKITVKSDNAFLGKTGNENIVKQENTITGATYEVVKGDTLWNIAIRAYGDGYKWVEIARENKLTHPSLIHPGNIIALPR